ncbi:hypothetical protein EW145_g4729 [Phellinidium pouzarii]|uniref:Uncharacterized protein n=1 Tax=Phellinidium pouzarii TaxID=167371 RepID=A0A4S4L4B1_9AGAM|nr:hypothetical protein EW145_g4729 [Phellinidium pouzarii]
MSSGAMMSNVGNPQVYNDDDQRTYKRGEDPSIPPRYEAGQENSHDLLDSKDQRSLSNRLDAAVKAENDEGERVQHARSTDPRAPAEWHGNEPSRGAQIDAELKEDDEETLRRKGIA